MSISIEGHELNTRLDIHLLRKAWHIGTGLGGLFLYFHFSIPKTEMALSLLSIALIGLLVEFIRMRTPEFNTLVLKFLGPLMRESEKAKYSGFVFYALGASLTLLIFEEKIAILAILFLILADPSCSLIGVIYGKDQIVQNKSLQGSIAGYVVCFFVSFFYLTHFNVEGLQVVLFAMIAGFIGSASELMSVFADDNLTIPLASGLGLTLLNIIFQIL